MKLLLDNIIFSAQRAGGISVVWYELLQRLLNDSRFDCRFLEYKNSQENIYRKRLNLPDSRQIFPGFQFPTAIQSRLLPHVELKEKTLFHSSYYRILKDNNALNITTVHDFIYEKYVTGLRRTLHVWQKSRAIRNSHAIICVSQNTRDDLLHYYPEVDPSRISVVYNGVSDEFFPDRESKLEIPFESGSYLLFVGGRSGYKSFLPVVKSLKNTKMNLVIVGGPSLSEEEVCILDSAIGKNHYLHLRGIANSQLNLLYNHAYAFLYPSAYEGFGIPIVEAQKAGCPVICRDTAISHEVAADAAVFFSEYSEIPSLIQHAESQKKILIPAGFQNAHRFSWDKTYQETTAVYLQISG